jgi:hypothetical protein
MVNSNALKGAIIREGLTQVELAKFVNLTKQSLNYKILNKATFNINEVAIIRKVLNLSSEELISIFFA